MEKYKPQREKVLKVIFILGPDNPVSRCSLTNPPHLGLNIDTDSTLAQS